MEEDQPLFDPSDLPPARAKTGDHMFKPRYNPKLWIGSVKKAAYPFA